PKYPAPPTMSSTGIIQIALLPPLLFERRWAYDGQRGTGVCGLSGLAATATMGSWVTNGDAADISRKAFLSIVCARSACSGASAGAAANPPPECVLWNDGAEGAVCAPEAKLDNEAPVFGPA